MISKAIIMGGGNATRLWPSTRSVTKQLLPVYDKPMIYYPLATVIANACTDIAIVCKEQDWPAYRLAFELLEELGVHFTPLFQPQPMGIAQAYSLAERWLDGQASYLALGDNVFITGNPSQFSVNSNSNVPTIWEKWVKDVSRYGSLEYSNGKPVLVEKPKTGHRAVTGFYAFPPGASEKFYGLTLSKRGQYEITDLLMSWPGIDVRSLSSTDIWADAGTSNDLLDISEIVRHVQAQSDRLIGSPELALISSGMVTINDLSKAVRSYNELNPMVSSYYKNLLNYLNEGEE